MLIAVVYCSFLPYSLYSIGFLHYDNLKCILWGSQALTEAEREERKSRKVRVHAKYKGAVSQPLIGRSIYESNIPIPDSPCGNTEPVNIHSYKINWSVWLKSVKSGLNALGTV